MSAPIKREDIRKGDRVRHVEEFTASSDGAIFARGGGEWELIERPVVLPDVPGWYVTPGSSHHLVFLLNGNADWYAVSMSGEMTKCDVGYITQDSGPLTRLRPEAEVAADVLDEVHDRTTVFTSDYLTIRRIDVQNIADKFGAKK